MKYKKIFVNKLLLGWICFFCQGAMAWEINEIYSNEDGSIQFIELFSSSDNQDSLQNITIVSTENGSSNKNTYTFDSNLEDTATANHSLLLATPGFSVLPGGIAPDYEIPFDFLFITGALLHKY